jgi:hypothetical protein
MTTAKWTSIQERSKIHAILLQDLMKRGVCRCRGGDAISPEFVPVLWEPITITPWLNHEHYMTKNIGIS